MSVQRPTPPIDNQWARAVWAEGGGYMQKQQSALTIALKLIIGGLTSVILIALSTINLQFPHNSVGKESACSAGDLGSIPGSGRFLWRRERQPTPVFLPGESCGQRSLAGYSPWGRRVAHNWVTLTTTTNLQFQSRFVSISLRPVLGTVAVYVRATVRSSCC